MPPFRRIWLLAKFVSLFFAGASVTIFFYFQRFLVQKEGIVYVKHGWIMYIWRCSWTKGYWKMVGLGCFCAIVGGLSRMILIHFSYLLWSIKGKKTPQSRRFCSHNVKRNYFDSWRERRDERGWILKKSLKDFLRDSFVSPISLP